MHRRILGRGALASLAVTVLLVAPAAAHPFFEPREVPVDSLTTVTLDLAHGCIADHGAGEADGDDGEPTREVAVEVPEQASYIEPGELEGWSLELETDDEGWVEVVVWSAEEGTDEPAPRFDLDVVLRGEVGDEVHWRVLQACDDTTHRWVGTPDEPAEEPAVTVVLAEADEDAPPPPEDQLEAAEQPAAPTDPEEIDDPGETEEPEEDVDVEEDVDEAEDLTAEDEDAPGMPGWILIAVLLATLVVAGVLLFRGRDTDDTGGDGEPSD